MDQDGTWHGLEALGSRHIVLDGDPASLPKRGQSRLQFSDHFYCGQTARCIKMPLGMELSLSPGDFVFDGDPATPRKKGTLTPPNFWTMSIVSTNGWMDEDATWYGSRPQHRPHCIRRGPGCPRKGHRSSPSFRPMSIVAIGHGRPSQLLLSSCTNGCQKVKTQTTRMWANAQRDGRPAEHRWRPLFNAAKFA